MSRDLVRAAAATALAALLATLLLHRLAPFPSADVARGTEECFARSGLYPRELPPRELPRRWTGERAVLALRNLPAGPGRLEVRAHGQRGPVAVVVGGAVAGALAPEATGVDVAVIVPADGTLEVALVAQEPIQASGRTLGTQLDRVTLLHGPAGAPPLGLVAGLMVSAFAVLMAGIWSGLGPRLATALAILLVTLESWVLCFAGLVRSAYAQRLPVQLVIGVAAAAVMARLVKPEPRRSAFLAVLAAVLVQGLAGTAPFMVVSDAVFHANKLMQVARGDFFPTSVTQHARPFEIPYGVSFYALLAPLARVGIDAVTLVRGGAAVAGILASAALFGLLASTRPAWSAFLAVLILQLLPGSFDVYSFGNLSNIFGQAITVLFFAWWAGSAPGGFLVGGTLLALGGMAHLSSLIVLVLLALMLALVGRRELMSDRSRSLALLLGGVAFLLYYLHFLPLARDQLPRLLEGGGQGRGASIGPVGALKLQVLGAIGQWGWPALLLAIAGWPRPKASGLERQLVAFWIAGALLFLMAVVSPLDVRYLYALTLPVAIAAADAVAALSARATGLRVAAWGLVAWQAVIGARGMIEALFDRYR